VLRHTRERSAEARPRAPPLYPSILFRAAMSASRRVALALLLSASAAGAAAPSTTNGECGEDCQAADRDSAVLLQLKQAGGAAVDTDAEGQSSACLGTNVQCAAQTAHLVASGKAAPNAMWYNMPASQDLSLMDTYHDQLTNVPVPEKVVAHAGSSTRLAMGSAADVAEMMYRASKVQGVTDKLPEKFRGVYWMRGNPVPEELMTMQYAQWYDDEGIIVLPGAPFMWSWAAGKPKNAPSPMYTEDLKGALGVIESLMSWQAAISAKFTSCVEGLWKTVKPMVCNVKDSSDKEAYGYMQMHWYGDLKHNADIGMLLYDTTQNLCDKGSSGAFTMQAYKNASDGTAWRRTIQFGKGSCADKEQGSYDLVKVLDGEGAPVQPYYDEFLEYMGDVPLMVWSGWKDAAAREAHMELLKDEVAQMSKGCSRHKLPVVKC